MNTDCMWQIEGSNVSLGMLFVQGPSAISFCFHDWVRSSSLFKSLTANRTIVY